MKEIFTDPLIYLAILICGVIYHQIHYIYFYKYRILETKKLDDNIHYIKMNNGLYMKIYKSNTKLNVFVSEEEYLNI